MTVPKVTFTNILSNLSYSLVVVTFVVHSNHAIVFLFGTPDNQNKPRILEYHTWKAWWAKTNYEIRCPNFYEIIFPKKNPFSMVRI